VAPARGGAGRGNMLISGVGSWWARKSQRGGQTEVGGKPAMIVDR